MGKALPFQPLSDESPLPASTVPFDTASGQTRLDGYVAALLLAFALILGGGGSPAPLPELLLEWLAVGVFAAWLLLPATRDHWRLVPRGAWLVCLLAVAVPLLQLVPLPPAVWQALPGREVEVEALSLIGQQDSWRALTLSSERTLASLLSLLPPLVMLIIASTLASRERLRLVAIMVGIALLSLAIGTLQLTASADSAVQFYGVTMPNLRGFQANHNSAADLLLAALIGSILLIRIAALRGYLPDRTAPVLGLSALAVGLFGFGTVFTASRMGIVLLPLAVLAGLVLLRGWLPRPGRKSVLAGLALMAVLLASGAALIRSNPELARIGQRFAFDNELRVELWKDGLYTARKHYPVGVGMGNFVPALIMDERLEVVRPAMPNRAHNEYVELSVEAGLPGLIVWAVIIGLLLRAAWRSRTLGGRSARAEAVFASGVLLLFALHSMVDYPFRSMSLATLGALCAAMLLAKATAPIAGSNEKDQM